MKSQAFANVDKGQALLAKKTLEVNPRHPIIVALKERANVDAEATGAAADVADIARLLYEAALLNSGFSLEDTRAFAGRVSRMVGSAMKLESLDLVPEITLPAKEEESAPSPPAEGGASVAAATYAPSEAAAPPPATAAPPLTSTAEMGLTPPAPRSRSAPRSPR